MKELRNNRKLELCISPIHRTDQVPFKLIFFNLRSLHKHIKDVCSDLNYTSADVSIFAERRFSPSDAN